MTDNGLRLVHSNDTLMSDRSDELDDDLYIVCMISKFPIRDAGWADVYTPGLLWSDPTIDERTIVDLRMSRKDKVKVDNPFGMDFIEEFWIRTVPAPVTTAQYEAIAREGFNEAMYDRVEVL